jgi:hypothetical protein
MDKPPKIANGEVISAYSRRKVHVFRVPRKRKDGSLGYDSCFTMRACRSGRRAYFRLPSSVEAAKKEADRIAAFLELRSNSLDDAIRKFDPDRWAAKIRRCG